jgi:hypothetical protein
VFNRGIIRVIRAIRAKKPLAEENQCKNGDARIRGSEHFVEQLIESYHKS